MKSFLFTAALVLGGIWLWSKLGAPTKRKSIDNTVPVDTGTYFGPYVDTKTGASLAPSNTPGAVQFPTQPIGQA